MKIPALLKFFLTVLAAYMALKAPGLLAGKPVPGSLITMYMFFIIVTTLLAMTFTDEGAKELFAPIKALVEDPSRKTVRNIVFVIAPLAAAYFAYTGAKPASRPAAQLRAAHPTPPSVVKAYGNAYNLATLENPFRKAQKENPAEFKALVDEGGGIYFRNCFFCHGDKLDGKGHYAQALDPLPLPFQGKDTIAQLQESYVFWRIVKGGPGLPREGGPALSSMPAWEEMLTEEEVWKVILFIYDYTGNTPRSWGK